MLSMDKSIDTIQRVSKPKVTLQFSGLSANYMNYTALIVTNRVTDEWVTHRLNVSR